MIITELGKRRVLSALALTCSLAFAATLVYFANIAQPTQIASISPQPAISQNDLTAYLQPDGPISHGVLQVIVSGTITDPTVSRLVFVTHSPGSAKAHRQANCCVISGLTFAGTAEIGTAQTPVTQVPVVVFQLLSSAGIVEATGSITLRIESFPAGSKLAFDSLATALSLIASLIALAQLLPGFGRSERRNDANENFASHDRIARRNPADRL